MKFQISQKQLSLSWNACMAQNILANEHTPGLIIPKQQVQRRLMQNQLLISAYKQVVLEVNDYLEGNYLFTLTDPNGVMLLINLNSKMSHKVDHYPVYPGVSLAEESCGTNAVALSIKHNDSVYLSAEQHYCHFMRDWYGFAVPLQVHGKPAGFLCMSSLMHPLTRELLVLVELLAFKLEKSIEQNTLHLKNTVQLTGVQLQILQLLSVGLTEKAVASQLNLNINTIKYHKKNIFRKLNAQCTTEAIAKAITSGLIHCTQQ